MGILPKDTEILPPYDDRLFKAMLTKPEAEVLMSISKDERERAIFRSRRIALADRESDRVTSERVGRMAVARKALQKGMSVDDVIDISSLTRAEVENLQDAD